MNEEEEVTASQRTDRELECAPPDSSTHVSSLPSPSSFSTTCAALGDVFFENTLRRDKGDGAHGSECAQRGEKPRGSGKDEKTRVRREEERPIWELTRRCQDKQKSQGSLTSRHCCCAMASAGVAARALNDRHEREASE